MVDGGRTMSETRHSDVVDFINLINFRIFKILLFFNLFLFLKVTE